MTTPETSPPTVSIMMPARNVGRVIASTVRSIQAQTWTDWELVFVDDGSTDDTLAVVRDLAAADPRVRVFAIPHGGRGRARNACLAQVRGEFIAVCDADDVSFPARFERQVRHLRAHPDIGAVGSWWIPFATPEPGGDGPVRRFPCGPDEIRDAFRRGKMRFHNATVMMRTELVRRFGGYNVELRRAQDYEFFSRMSRQGVRFQTLPEPLLYYRQEATVQSAAYFVENGLFMAYADRVLAGDDPGFEVFAASLSGRLWKAYYRLKYVYYYLKLQAMGLLGR